jgi:hypothetical protein
MLTHANMASCIMLRGADLVAGLSRVGIVDLFVLRDEVWPGCGIALGKSISGRS